MKAKRGIPTIATNGANFAILTFKDTKNGMLGDRHMEWKEWVSCPISEKPVPAVKLRLKPKQP